MNQTTKKKAHKPKKWVPPIIKSNLPEGSSIHLNAKLVVHLLKEDIEKWLQKKAMEQTDNQQPSKTPVPPEEDDDLNIETMVSIARASMIKVLMKHADMTHQEAEAIAKIETGEAE